MKKLAIPIEKGKLSEYFGKCNHYQLFLIDESGIRSKDLKVPPREELIKLPEWASKQGITDIITYKIDKQIINEFTNYKINLFVGVEITFPDQLVIKFLNGKLKSNKTIIHEIITY
ncbi:MAG: hypothetical protein JXB49_22530 [Bacteroidales bacterium]|nr:hypothetical protein [Bacteroidales bacterium]